MEAGNGVWGLGSTTWLDCAWCFDGPAGSNSTAGRCIEFDPCANATVSTCPSKHFEASTLSCAVRKMKLQTSATFIGLAASVCMGVTFWCILAGFSYAGDSVGSRRFGWPSVASRVGSTRAMVLLFGPAGVLMVIALVVPFALLSRGGSDIIPFLQRADWWLITSMCFAVGAVAFVAVAGGVIRVLWVIAPMRIITLLTLLALSVGQSVAAMDGMTGPSATAMLFLGEALTFSLALGYGVMVACSGCLNRNAAPPAAAVDFGYSSMGDAGAGAGRAPPASSRFHLSGGAIILVRFSVALSFLAGVATVVLRFVVGQNAFLSAMGAQFIPVSLVVMASALLRPFGRRTSLRLIVVFILQGIVMAMALACIIVPLMNGGEDTWGGEGLWFTSKGVALHGGLTIVSLAIMVFEFPTCMDVLRDAVPALAAPPAYSDVAPLLRGGAASPAPAWSVKL